MAHLHAYIDESSRRRPEGDRIYLMAAVVIPGVTRLDLQRQLRELVPKGSDRLHFGRDQHDLRRRHLTLLNAAARTIRGFTSLASIARDRHQDRARVHCLSSLVGHLSDLGVEEVVIESRQRHRDKDDDRTLLQRRQEGLFGADLLWRHDVPSEEPLLWPADAIANVMSGHLARQDPHGYWSHLPEQARTVIWEGDL